MGPEHGGGHLQRLRQRAGGGDGLLTASIQYVDSTGLNNRTTQYDYDWRDRLTTTTASDGTTTYIDLNL